MVLASSTAALPGTTTRIYSKMLKTLDLEDSVCVLIFHKLHAVLLRISNLRHLLAGERTDTDPHQNGRCRIVVERATACGVKPFPEW